MVMVSAQSRTDPIAPIAERYVKLVLAVGQHDADYVDAFYGPAEWRKSADAAKTPLPAIDAQAAALEGEIPAAFGAIRPATSMPATRGLDDR